MGKKTSIGRLVYRGVACLLAFLLLCGMCLIPSKNRVKEEDQVEAFIDRTFTALTQNETPTSVFAVWYPKLAAKERSAVDFVESVVYSPSFLEKRYPDSRIVELIYVAMVDHLPDDATEAKYTEYLDEKVSERYLLQELSKDPDYSDLCTRYDVLPGTFSAKEPRDQDPEVTLALGRLYFAVRGMHPDSEEVNTWTERFLKQEASVMDFIEQYSAEIPKDPSGNELAPIISCMLEREVTSSELEEYAERLEQGVSSDYVLHQVCESGEFREHWLSQGIEPGTFELTQQRDLNVELTSFISRFYLCLTGRKATEDELNSGISRVLSHEVKIQTMLAEVLDTPESQALLSDNSAFLDAVYEVLYGEKPDPATVEGYLIGLNNGVLRSRILEEIAKDPAFDEQMKAYGFDTSSEKVIPEKMVALTFDDGPYTPVTFRIMDMLEAYGAHATFFVIGNRVANYPECLIRAVNLGCEIGNHTWNHTKLTKLSGSAVAQQIADCDQAVYNICGFHTRLMRPMGGSFNSTVAANVGLPMIMWCIDTNDWRYKDTNHIITEILDNVKDGDIILMHDIYECTADAMEVVIPELISRGYTLVTVSELAEYKGKELQTGESYRSIRGG